MSISINSDRLWSHLEMMSSFTVPDKPWTRRAFTDLYAEARGYLTATLSELGLSVEIDSAGNLVSTLKGSNSELPPIVVGSHIDTVESGGRYDGVLGVIAGVEVVHALQENNLSLSRDLKVIDFLSEEPSDYGVSCIGSRGLVGDLSAEMLAFTNQSGESLREAIIRVGGDPDRLNNPLVEKGDIAAFVELHIEQGRVLESSFKDIGVVNDIVGIHRYDVSLIGQADHAGTTPMDIRKDALFGAACLIKSVYEEGRRLADKLSSVSGYFVATTGVVNCLPNAANAVPSEVSLTVEVRSNDESRLKSFFPEIASEVRLFLEGVGLKLKYRDLSEGSPTYCDELIKSTVKKVASRSGASLSMMSSGAGHDAVYMAKVCPSGMIFTPCLNGRSHCPEENVTKDQAALGTQVLFDTVLELDRLLCK